jgi:hypothetical protein
MKARQRIMHLLEIYENKDLFDDRAEHLEHSRLDIKDELIV